LEADSFSASSRSILVLKKVQVLVTAYDVAETWHMVIMPTTVRRSWKAIFLDIEEEVFPSFKEDEILAAKLAVILQDMPGR
jgi:hypothetical protein